MCFVNRTLKYIFAIEIKLLFEPKNYHFFKTFFEPKTLDIENGNQRCLEGSIDCRCSNKFTLKT